MKSKEALDAITQSLRDVDVHLSGDDSPFANPWEEIKHQLQHELSNYWSAYLETISQFISSFVASLPIATRAALCADIKCADVVALEKMLLRMLLLRAKKEKVLYIPFDFSYFCFPIYDFTAYGRVLQRTGMYEFRAQVFSAAAPFGEEGLVNTNAVEDILTEQQFEKASSDGWPEFWSAHG